MDKLEPFSMDAREVHRLSEDFKGETIEDLMAHLQKKLRKDKDLLKEGDVIQLRRGHYVNMWLPKHFALGDNYRGDFSELVSTQVEIGQVCNDLTTDFLVGAYIVVKTTEDGGADPDSPPGQDCSDGHHVFCQSVEFPNVKVNFYQTGPFKNKIDYLKPVGRATATWSIDD